MTRLEANGRFYGWRVVAAAFVLAIFGLGLGFHGPAIYLHAVHERTQWSIAFISLVVTLHFLIGAVTTANLPKLHRQFGLASVTMCGALVLGIGIIGWALAAARWQLVIAAILTGAGWVTMGVAAINAFLSPWFERRRPQALAFAYNGANLGGIIFAPLWVFAISQVGFAASAAVISLFMIAIVWPLASCVLSRSPDEESTAHRRDDRGSLVQSNFVVGTRRLPQQHVWRDTRFLTLTLGMALGLFAQIGLISHLFSLLVPAFGTYWAGIALGSVTAMAIAGRTVIGWLMPVHADRRVIASLSYGVQILGCVSFLLAEGTHVPLLIAGVMLFGAGFGNGTWLPPLIAQAEFAGEDVPRVVALAVATSQATYAFAPLVFGLTRDLAAQSTASPTGYAPLIFSCAAIMQALSIIAFMSGRRRQQAHRLLD